MTESQVLLSSIEDVAHWNQLLPEAREEKGLVQGHITSEWPT